MTQSKKLLCGVATAALMVAVSVAVSPQAYAADPVHPAPAFVPEPSPDWSGPYIGGHVGYGAAEYEGCDSGGWPSECWGLDPDIDGFLLGVHAGYNIQDGRWVYGIEGDLTLTPGWSGGESTSGNPYSGIWGELGGIATLRGRLGMGLDRSLIYATGGIAFAQSKAIGCSTTGFCMSQATNDIEVGAVAGLGAEFKMRENISWRVEGLYHWFDQDQKEPDSSGHAGIQDTWMLRIGASWHY